MAAIKVPTSFNIDLEFEIPEFYRRLVALLIDVLVQFIYLKIAWEIFTSIASNYNSNNVDAGHDLSAIGMLFFLPVMIYHIVLEVTMNGQSIGKKIMGIRVVHENGGKSSIGQLMIRWLLRVSDLWIVMLLFLLLAAPYLRDAETIFVTIAGCAFLLTDIILVISSAKSQRLGDMLAHTIIIRTARQANIEETIFQEVADSYIPSFPQIMQLSDRDINAIKSILETARKKGDYDMAEAASNKIKNHLSIQSTMSPFEFLDTLLKDYNYLSVK
jgi:uncharacterized RDD family membrane protein YckC